MDKSNDPTNLRRRLPRNMSRDSQSDTDTDGELDEKIVKVEEKKPFDVKKVIIRSIVAALLASFIIGLVQSGHFCVIFMVLSFLWFNPSSYLTISFVIPPPQGVIIQIELYRELVNVRYVEAKERKMPAFRTLQWSWFFVALLSVYGETMRTYLDSSWYWHIFDLLTVSAHDYQSLYLHLALLSPAFQVVLPLLV